MSTLSLARCIQWVAKTIINRRHYQSIDAYYARKELTLRDLQVMDRDGDGTVSWSDFLEFMLLAMHKVDVEMVRELRKLFDRLDADNSGVVDKHDLIVQAKKQLHNPRRKLQLALYKQTLLSKSDQNQYWTQMPLSDLEAPSDSPSPRNDESSAQESLLPTIAR